VNSLRLARQVHGPELREDLRTILEVDEVYGLTVGQRLSLLTRRRDPALVPAALRELVG